MFLPTFEIKDKAGFVKSAGNSSMYNNNNTKEGEGKVKIYCCKDLNVICKLIQETKDTYRNSKITVIKVNKMEEFISPERKQNMKIFS